MSNLPNNRLVTVNFARNDKFPSKEGFGIPAIITTLSVTDEVDADNRGKRYATYDDVIADWDETSSVAKAALKGFSMRPAPIAIVVAHVEASALTSDANFVAQMNIVKAQAPTFYGVSITAELRDHAYIDGLIDWTEAQNAAFAAIDTNDANIKNSADTTNVAARNKTTKEQTAIFAHHDVEEYLGIQALCYMGSRNFDTANSAYTLHAKNFRGASPADEYTAAEVDAITGFVPQLGQNSTQGHCANTYVKFADLNMLVYGSTLKPNVFIDEIHFTHWAIARAQEAMIEVLANNDVVPYDEEGATMLRAAVEGVMDTAYNAGNIAKVENESGGIEAAYEVTSQPVNQVTEQTRKNRIAPKVTARFRYRGSMHYVIVDIFMQF